MNTNKKLFLSDEDFKEISLEMQIKRMRKIREEEKVLINLPYADDMLDIDNTDGFLSSDLHSSSMFLALVLSPIVTINLVRKQYPGRFTPLYCLRNLPKVFFAIYLFGSCKFLFFCNLQPQNVRAQETVSEEELMYNILQEKTDMYDSIDAILNLKDKYSQYELNQLKKEEKERNAAIIRENMKLLSKLNH